MQIGRFNDSIARRLDKPVFGVGVGIHFRT
jgi:hypothetical protein